MHRSLLFLCIITMSFQSIGQWYNAEGEATITEAGEQTARREAMEDALQKALLVAGASVSSIQQVVNGLLTQDQISIRASGIVNSLELISETYTDDKISVMIRADIFPQEHQCTSADYRKSLLINRTELSHRHQANIGQIYQIDTALSQHISSKLKKESHFIDAKVAVQQRTNFFRLYDSFQLDQIKQLTMSLADLTSSQYVMFTNVTDLSFAEEKNNKWQIWQENNYDRNFHLAVYLYNGVNGESIFEKEYYTSAPWNFSKRKKVDVNGIQFWDSTYGKNVSNTIDDVIKDIDEQLMCQQSRGKITQINVDTLTINLGRRHGLKIGDEFSILHLANFTGDDKKAYSGFNLSPYKVKVTKLSNDNAQAVSSNGHVLGSVQINDVVVRDRH